MADKVTYADKETERTIKENLTQIRGLLEFMKQVTPRELIEFDGFEAMTKALINPLFEIENLVFTDEEDKKED